MKKILSFFSILSLIITPSHINFVQKTNVNVLQDDNDYLYTDEEIIKEFYEPIAFSKEQKGGLLFIPKNYDTRLEIKLPDEDLKLIKKEILEVKLEFDFKLFWEGQQKNSQTLENHVQQFLDFEHLQTPLLCGNMIWKTYYFGELKIQSLIEFSWEDGILILEHKNNDFLKYDQIIQLAFFENNGLTKMNLQLTNLKLIYQIPKIFNQLPKINLNLEYQLDLNSFPEINELVVQAISDNAELKRLKFTNYFNYPTLTVEQKENLLKIRNDFQIELQLLLQLKPGYQEDIFIPLLKKLSLKITFFQFINLDKLILNKHLKINESDDPWEFFVNQNLNYKTFFLNYCDFEVFNNHLLIEPKLEYSNLTGNLNLLIEYNQIFKKNLSELNLKKDLGIFEFENQDQFLEKEDIFNRWKEYNENILKEEEYTDYSIEQKENTTEYFLIIAKESNKNFKGELQVYLKIVYFNDQDKLPKRPSKSDQNFLKKYWWVLVLGSSILILIIWLILKIRKDKKGDKT